jgi:hypothetical protein
MVFNSSVKKACGLKFEYKACSFGFGSNCNNLLYMKMIYILPSENHVRYIKKKDNCKNVAYLSLVLEPTHPKNDYEMSNKFGNEDRRHSNTTLVYT